MNNDAEVGTLMVMNKEDVAILAVQEWTAMLKRERCSQVEGKRETARSEGACFPDAETR